MSARDGGGARATGLRPKHALDDALASADSGLALCAELAACGYAVVVLPERLRPLIAAVRLHAAAFFDLDNDEKERVGNFARVGRTAYAGYRREREARSEFLELHCDSTGKVRPALPAQLPALEPAACALSWALLGVAHSLLRLMARALQLPEHALAAPLDPPQREALAVDGVLQSALRVCRYAQAPAPPGAAPAARLSEVVFGEHTDSSLLTLALADRDAPGLQLRARGAAAAYAMGPDAAAGWDSVETAPAGWRARGDGDDACCLDLIVMVGDFAQVLTKGFYPAASHRVVRAADMPARLSMPFLARPRAEFKLETAALEPRARAGEGKLLALDGVTCAQVRRLLDARGRKLHLQQLEEERSRAGRAFREQLLARRADRAARSAVCDVTRGTLEGPSGTETASGDSDSESDGEVSKG